MLVPFLLLGVLQTPPQIPRDSYGVPRIHAETLSEAFFQAGYAVAQDRLWQMENSRRLSRGKMSEVFGTAFLGSDKEVLSTFYTDEELQKQVDALSPKTRACMDDYVRGINAYIDQASAAGSLPKGYADNGFKPDRWTLIDTAAIAVRLFQQFGTGGAGELRNLAFLQYLQGRPNLKGKVANVWNDIFWQNELDATCTVNSEDDTLAHSHPDFTQPSKSEVERQMASAPKPSLFELIAALTMVTNQESKRIAEKVNVPYRTGSYCMVVSPSRSATGNAMLLSGPQMGFRNPSIVHELSVDCPEMQVAGADVPGVPGFAVGYTPNLAWGLTSGVADLADIFYFKLSGSNSYLYDGKTYPLQTIERKINVKGQSPIDVVQKRTMFGPAILVSSSSGYVFSSRTSYFGKELQNLDALFGVYEAKRSVEFMNALKTATMTFNCFYAMKDGAIGYRYAGMMPIRAPGLDPRLPTPADPKNDWKGFVPFDQMPHVENPKVGLIVNWNNKPVSWWPNMDTPVWGKIFRNHVILDNLTKDKLGEPDLELAAWSIAREDETYPYFKGYIKMISDTWKDPKEAVAARYLKGFDGKLLDGSIAAGLYAPFIDSLRKEIFISPLGSIYAPQYFNLALQPSLMLKALEGKTTFDYLGGRKQGDIVNAAFERAYEQLVLSKSDPDSWRYSAPGIRVMGQPAIPYSNRGTFIQIVEMLPDPSGRNVVPPGEAEAGEHSTDQIPLARAWTFKRFHW